MDLENLSIEAISAWKLANVQAEFGVKTLAKANEQNKSTASQLVETIKSAPDISSATGKGGKLHLVA